MTKRKIFCRHRESNPWPSSSYDVDWRHIRKEIRLDKQPLSFVHRVNQLLGCHVRGWRETRVFKLKYISWFKETAPADITHVFLVINCLYVCQLAVIQALWHPISSMGNQVHGTQSLTMCCHTKRSTLKGKTSRYLLHGRLVVPHIRRVYCWEKRSPLLLWGVERQFSSQDRNLVSVGIRSLEGLTQTSKNSI